MDDMLEIVTDIFAQHGVHGSVSVRYLDGSLSRVDFDLVQPDAQPSERVQLAAQLAVFTTLWSVVGDGMCRVAPFDVFAFQQD
jgi:hypothetical protein